MTQSLFDPNGPQAEHSGSRNLGPEAQDISHMPADVTDGRVDPETPETAVDSSAATDAIASAELQVQQHRQAPH